MPNENETTFDVHICAVVRIKVSGVKAGNIVEAAKLAEKSIDIDHAVKNGQTEFDDVITEYFVDTLNNGERVGDGQTVTVEQVDAL